ncbi:MAG: isoleucine--tRNA ligase [Candidatus Euphemobacter frigidus]|nr:isoleucine--tRNA ligase [Candidatus Euphemobacter frigidus]
MNKNYKDTLNLPKTSFGMRANLAQKEPQFLSRWKEMKLYSRIREARLGKPKYTLHDGPPYPTGDLHIGTGMNKILKDIIVRFQTMGDLDAPFIPGWDCHGLPIEHKVMTELASRAQEMTDSQIRQRCRQFALRYVEANRKQFQSLGCIGDWDNPYLTINPRYESAVLKIFKLMVEKGYIYRELKPIHWCFSCRTALAEAELEYRDREDPSIYLHLPLISPIDRLFPGEETGPASILVWTTTPWTLPGNLATAVHPEFQYVLVTYPDPESKQIRRMIVAEGTLERVARETGVAGYSIVGKVPGRELEGLLYRHPWFDKECPVILADYVNLEDGTGCVHTAPGHGQEDYLSGRKYGLEIISPVDGDGAFTDEVTDLAGRNVLEANEMIVERLRGKGLLLSRQTISHSYPHCWRCHQPVIFRATRQWFVSLTNRGLREKALDEVERVRWVPNWGKSRIRAMLERRPDWCISRQRKWGVPIPVFYCRKCGEILLDPGVIENMIRLFEERGSDCWFELSEEDLLPQDVSCSHCGGRKFKKENDIFDVWFESGSSHRAVVMENSELRYPADLYLEGTDQHRGWFQLSLLLAIATTDQAPFRTVLTHGFVVDQKGEKMSKSRGNFISVEGALKKFPADILRLWFSSVDYRKDIGVSLDLIRKISESYRKIRNTFKYCLGNLSDFKPETDRVPLGEMDEIDRWALQEVEELRDRVTRAYQKFEFHKVYREIHNFSVIQMSSFYMDVLKDRLYTYAANGPERRSTQTALWEITSILTRLLAPILVFTAEEVWEYLRSMTDLEESVHLSLWPAEQPEWRDEGLKEKWDRLLLLRAEALKLLEKYRGEGMIGTSLEAGIVVQVADPEWEHLLKEYEDELPKLFIVSEVEVQPVTKGDFDPAAHATELPGIRLLVGRARGEKCARCWKYSPTVGDFRDHPQLCAQCLEQMAIC